MTARGTTTPMRILTSAGRVPGGEVVRRGRSDTRLLDGTREDAAEAHCRDGEVELMETAEVMRETEVVEAADPVLTIDVVGGASAVSAVYTYSVDITPVPPAEHPVNPA